VATESWVKISVSASRQRRASREEIARCRCGTEQYGRPCDLRVPELRSPVFLVAGKVSDFTGQWIGWGMRQRRDFGISVPIRICGTAELRNFYEAVRFRFWPKIIRYC
jgi:hypothetical protein